MSRMQTRSKTTSPGGPARRLPDAAVERPVSSATDVDAGGGARPRRRTAAAAGKGAAARAASSSMVDRYTLLDEDVPMLDAGDSDGARSETAPQSEAAPLVDRSRTRRTQWIVLALASGACAAFNGVFAKLTTTDLTSSFSSHIAALLHAPGAEKPLEVIFRGSFFGLNLLFNGIMWTLFTQALARGTSTTQVSILNTSSNFIITAVLGFAIFSEALPPLWWLGAGLLVAGNVIAGRKDESESGSSSSGAGASAVAAAGLEGISVAAEVTAEEIAPLLVAAAEREEEEEEGREEHSYEEITPSLLPAGAPVEKDADDNIDLDLEAGEFDDEGVEVDR